MIDQSSLLASVNWAHVSRAAAREVINREKHSPAVSAFRWWARRPHSVMGALLEVATDRFGDGLLVSDPFSGGGTVAFEAARRGLRMYAQDLYPWPTYGLATTLGWVNASDFNAASLELLAAMRPLRSLYSRPDGREISHIIRIRQVRCSACEATYFPLPESLVSLCSRALNERFGFFVCVGCGQVSRRPRDCCTFTCDSCELKQRTRDLVAACPHCDALQEPPPAKNRNMKWTPVLVSELVRVGSLIRTRLRAVEKSDPVDLGKKFTPPQALKDFIPRGIETTRLLLGGFESWADLYSTRQLQILVGALHSIRKMDLPEPTKDRLALCVIGAAEMPALLSRWDRFNLKPFEGLANHRYTLSPIVAESNPLSPVGRGTLERRLGAAAKAIDWLRTTDTPRKVATRNMCSRGRRPQRWDTLIATGSSVRQALPDDCVDVVLTDPPYHDDVQYGELARLFHAWLRVHRPTIAVDEEKEAVANTTRDRSKGFEQTIANCLAESERTLRGDGVLLLTFHNRDLRAWRGLAVALHAAGFAVKALAVVHAENQHDHCKRNVNAMIHDLVVECRKRGSRFRKPRLVFEPSSVATKNLAAIGLAVATVAWTGEFGDLRGAYLEQLSFMRGRKRLIE